MNNYNQHDINSALSVRSIKVGFENEADQYQYENVCRQINNKIHSAIRATSKEYKDKIEELKLEQKSDITDQEKRKITMITRCVKYGKRFSRKKRGYENAALFKKQLEHILAVLLQAHSSNKMVWLNRNKVHYYKKNLNRYFRYIFDYDALCLSFDLLVYYGYLDQIEFEKGSRHKKGQCTRYVLSGISEVFAELSNNFTFSYNNMKETIILKNEVTSWKIEKNRKDETIRYKNGNPKRIKSTKKMLVNYEDTDFTNNRREFIENYNNDIFNNKIIVNAKNVFLKKTLLPKLYSMIKNNKIRLISIDINCNIEDSYLLLMYKYNIKGIKDILSVYNESVSENQYKYILSKKMTIYKICYFNSNQYDEYVLFRDLTFEILGKDIRSIFNRGNLKNPEELFTKGGRFYDQVVQSLPKDLRKFIHIDGKPCLSGDYKALHINLAYNTTGSECPHVDPYDIVETNRDEVKLASLIAINATSLNDAVWATQSKIKKQLSREITEEHADCLVAKFAENNPVLAGMIGNDTGVTFQNYDSIIMQDALAQHTFPTSSIGSSLFFPMISR